MVRKVVAKIVERSMILAEIGWQKLIEGSSRA
jgi:hypothetical protein